MGRHLTPAATRDAIEFYLRRLERILPAMPDAMEFARQCQSDLPARGEGRRPKHEISDPTTNSGKDPARTARDEVSAVLRGSGTINEALSVMESFVANYTRPAKGAQPNPEPMRTTVASCLVCQLPLVSGGISAGMCRDSCYHRYLRAGRPEKNTPGWSGLLDETAQRLHPPAQRPGV